MTTRTLGMKDCPAPAGHVMAGRLECVYPEPPFVMLTPVTAPRVVVVARLAPLPLSGQVKVGGLPVLYPDPADVTVTDCTTPPLTEHVPAAPVPVQGLAHVTIAVVAAPSVYPEPPAVTATDKTPSAVHVPTKPLPLQPGTPEQLADAVPPFV